MIKENYQEFQEFFSEKDADGIPYPFLEFIGKPGQTRISKELSALIIKAIAIFKDKLKLDEILHYSKSSIGLFNTIDGTRVSHFYLCYGENSLELFKDRNKQLILCDLSAEEEMVAPLPYQALAKCIKRIKENDVAIIAASENNLLEIRKIIDSNDRFIKAIFHIDINKKFTKHTLDFESSSNIYIPFESGMYLLVVDINKNKKEYIAKIDATNKLDKIFEEFQSTEHNDPIELSFGNLLKVGEYNGERQYQIQLRMEAARKKLQNSASDFKNFPKKTLGEISVRFNFEKIDPNESQKNNCVFINPQYLELDNYGKPLFFRYSKFDTKQSSRLNDDNHLCIELNENIVDANYCKYFFDSEFGRLIFESMSPNKKYSLDDIKNLWIYLPAIESQKKILSTIRKIDESKKNLTNINFDMVLNPSTFDDATKKINKILDVFGELADFEKVKSKIYEGESKTLEFKQTFSMDILTQKKEKYIEDACIKTIAAFLNSDGGTLIVGVADNGDLIGLDIEINKFYKSNDKFLLHVKNAIKTRIGEECYPFINYSLIELDNRKILNVDCRPSNSAIYVDAKDFFVRTNPATDRLEGPKLVSYINNHWKIN